jgi:hypothetical protein
MGIDRDRVPFNLVRAGGQRFFRCDDQGFLVVRRRGDAFDRHGLGAVADFDLGELGFDAFGKYQAQFLGALTVASAAGSSLFRWAWANAELAVAKDASNATVVRTFFAK